jgi:hypothetical protein
MKKLGVILFGIVFILGLSIVTAAAQQVEIVNPNGVAFTGDWWPAPTAGILSDWGADADLSYVTAGEWYDSLMVDFVDPMGGPYTAINVKLRASSDDFGSMLSVGIYVGGTQIGYFPVTPVSGFQDYSHELTVLNMTAAELVDLQVEIVVTNFVYDNLNISAIQVELVSEGTDPIPVVTDPIPVKIDYRPYRNANPLNYRSNGKVLVVIFGSADFNVSQIDRESLRLAGVAPVRDRIRRVYSRADRARDDYENLVLMFKTKQLIKALEIPRGQELENGDRVILSLTGNLKDDGATPIEGQDTAVVFGKHPKHKKKGNWKNYWKRHRREKD